MRCSHTTSLLSARQDGRLSPRQDQALRNHLTACVACQRVEEQYRSLDAALGQLEQPISEPAITLRRLQRRILEERITPSQPRPLAARLFPAVARLVPAVLLLVAGLTIGAYLGGQILPPQTHSELSMEHAFPTVSMLDEVLQVAAATPLAEVDQ